MNSFWEGFEKAAEENPEGHHLRRYLLTNPISSAIEAEPGKKMEAFGEAFKHQMGHTVKGMGIGGLGGAGIGALTSIARAGRVDPQLMKLLAGVGALGGAQLGGTVGALIGQHGRKGSEIHGRHSKHRKKED